MPQPCSVCGSRRWRRDAVTGSVVCEEGHVLQDYRTENHDADGPSQFALQRRNIRKNRETIRKRGTRNDTHYTGDDAEYLKLQAIQLLLRSQVQALRKLWDVPEVFEMIIRDIWAYHLSNCILPSAPEYAIPNVTHMKSGAKKDGQGLRVGMEDSDDLADPDGSKSDDGTIDSDEFEAARMDEEILQEMSDDSDKNDPNRDGERDKSGDTGWKRKRRLRIGDTLVILVMGLWLIRRGTLFVEIESLVNMNVIPFLDFGHSTLIPEGMRTHMNRDVMNALSPLRSPSPLILFQAARRLAKSLVRTHGISIPEINFPQVAWRVIQPLGGTRKSHFYPKERWSEATAATYEQVTRLLAQCDMNLSLDDQTVSTFQRRRRRSQRGFSRTRSRNRVVISDDEVEEDPDEIRDPGGGDIPMEKYERARRYQEMFMPELAVAAGWVLVMKMAYGLDTASRQRQTEDGDIDLQPDGEVWIDQLRDSLDNGDFLGVQTMLSRQNFASMDDGEMDKYLDFSQNVLLDHRSDAKEEDTIDFSLSSPGIEVHPPPQRSWRHIYRNSLPESEDPMLVVDSATKTLKTAESLRSYDPKDITGTLPKAYEIVLTSASQVIGVNPVDVAEVVQILERRLEKARKTGRRASLRGKYGKGRKKIYWGGSRPASDDEPEVDGREGALSRKGSEVFLPRYLDLGMQG